MIRQASFFPEKKLEPQILTRFDEKDTITNKAALPRVSYAREAFASLTAR